MLTNEAKAIFDKIEAHAFNSLHWQQQQTSNLYIDRRVLSPGQRVGPPSQNTTVDRSSILVFVDDQPRTGFGHPCRYLLYDDKTGAFYRKIDAQFPPYPKNPDTYRAFHQPVASASAATQFSIRGELRCPLLVPEGERYAILFSGMSWSRNLNNHEFCYRMLIDRYGFKPGNIYVLRYDGTLNSGDAPATVWPGDGTAYRIHINAPGTRAAMQAAFNNLKMKLKPQDLLFLHTENEAGTDNQAFFAQYPNWDPYYASDFASDLGTLPKFQSLIVLMGQCYAGGFSNAVLTGSTAVNTSVACATSPGGSVWPTPDGHFVQFGCDWISAQMGHNQHGAPLAFNPDTDGDGVIEAEEAFNYAFAVRSLGDQPNFHESSEAGGDVTLAQQYEYWRWWCWLILEVLQRYYPTVPVSEFYAKVSALVPKLNDLIVPVVNRTARELSAELTPKVQSIVDAAFKR